MQYNFTVYTLACILIFIPHVLSCTSTPPQLQILQNSTSFAFYISKEEDPSSSVQVFFENTPSNAECAFSRVDASDCSQSFISTLNPNQFNNCGILRQQQQTNQTIVFRGTVFLRAISVAKIETTYQFPFRILFTTELNLFSCGEEQGGFCMGNITSVRTQVFATQDNICDRWWILLIAAGYCLCCCCCTLIPLITLWILLLIIIVRKKRSKIQNENTVQVS